MSKITEDHTLVIGGILLFLYAMSKNKPAGASTSTSSFDFSDFSDGDTWDDVTTTTPSAKTLNGVVNSPARTQAKKPINVNFGWGRI